MTRGRRSVFALVLSWACVFGMGKAADGADPIITEFMASNSSTIADEDGNSSDWLEVYNPNATSLDIGGWYLTDDATDLTKWAFPSTTIGPDEYLIVFASGKARATSGAQLHTNYKLSADGEYLALVHPDGVTVAQEYAPEYPPQRCDVSYGELAGGYGYFGTATPGAANDATQYPGFVEDVVLSVERGFYDTAFSLAMATASAGAQIRYTTNGATPTPTTGLVYDGPIVVDETAIVRSRGFRPDLLSSRTTTSTYVFVADVALQSQDGAKPGSDWPDPYGPHTGFHDPQDIDYGMDPDVTTDPRYADLIDDALLAIPTMSVVTDLEHLFDPSSGIYVNAKGRGEEWERPVSLELLQPDGTEGFQIDCGVRIRGGWSRWGSCPKHALRFYFDSAYGPSRLEYPLFGDEGAAVFAKIDLRTAQNYSWSFKGDSRNTLVRDVFCRTLQREMGQPYTRSRCCHLYINGQYWGLYQTQERAEAHFGATYFGGERDDYDTIKVGDTLDMRGEVEVADGDWEAWDALVAAAAAGFASDAAYYCVQGLHADGTPDPACERLVDIDNLIDYMISIYYMGTDDSPITSHLSNTCNNFYGLYNRNNPAGFTWLTHDNEHVMDITGLSYDRTSDLAVYDGDWSQYFNPQTLHQELDAHPEYVMRFADHVHRHFFNGGALVPERLDALARGFIEVIDTAIIAESARWGDAKISSGAPLTRDDDWAPRIDNILDSFIPQRTAIVLEQFRNRGWYPDVDAPTFLINGSYQHGGSASAGDVLTMVNPGGSGAIYYTLDGTDPRLVGGGVSATAVLYDGAGVPLSSSVVVKSRVLDGVEWSALNEASFAVSSLPLVINEIMYNPAVADGAEFVEVYNPSSSLGVDVSGWRLDGVGLTFAEGTVVAAESYLLVVRDWAVFESVYGSGVNVTAEYSGRLDNGGENLVLRDCDGVAIDSVRYDDDAPWPTNADGVGYSLELIDVESDNDRVANWSASLVEHGTPGTANGVAGVSAAVPPLWVNEVVSVNTSVNVDEMGEYDPWIEIYNSSDSAVDVGGMYLTDDYGDPTKWSLPAETVIPGTSWLVVWADGEPVEGLLHTSFALSSQGGSVGLYTAGGVIVDYLNYGVLSGDTAYGKFPDGTSLRRVLSVATPGYGNMSAVSRVILNEYNAVSSSNYLKDGGSDTWFGRVEGNGGNWFELVVTEDHTDMSGWSLEWSEENDSGSLTLTSALEWSDLRSGTIVTFSESDSSAGGLDTDASYDPESGDWWIHINTLSGGVAQESYVTTTTNVSGDGPGNFSVGNDGWQLRILDSSQELVYGPAGEGISPLSGIGSDEVFKLEEDPSPLIHPYSDYNDGTSSTFGSPNIYASGTAVQDLTVLRNVFVACEHDEDCEDGLFCNGESFCVDDVCVAGEAPCDDGVQCTDDLCDESTDSCTYTPNDSLCSNGLFCDGVEACDALYGCQAGTDPCPGLPCDELNDVCVSGECVEDADCADGVFCNGEELCVDQSCVSGAAPCSGVCEACDESTDSCMWCIFDLDGDEFIGPGDFSFFAGCYGGSYACDPPNYRSGADPCCITNFDESADSFVGPGDFSGLAGCYGGGCGECANCWGQGR